MNIFFKISHSGSHFLADINNMKEEKNPEYKEIISNLDNFVMIKWENDETIIPRESSHFGFYVLGQDNVTEPLEVLSTVIRGTGT